MGERPAPLNARATGLFVGVGEADLTSQIVLWFHV
jgi:hypothetical protein